MGNTFTDHDMRDQVAQSLGGEVGEYDIPAIVDEIQSAYGTVPIDEVPHVIYWGIVLRHCTDPKAASNRE